MVRYSIASDANRFDRVGARVHDVHHPAAVEELAILVGEAGDRLAFLTCPKAESEADVLRFLDRLTLETARRGLGREIPVSVMIETHGAVREAWAIAALPGVVSLDFGTMDFVSAQAQVEIVSPKEGDVSMLHSQGVTVRSAAGMRVDLFVNGSFAKTDTVRIDGV